MRSLACVPGPTILRRESPRTGGSIASVVEQLAAARTAGRLVLVSGEAGVGKSALVDAFCDRHADGCRVLIGRCDDLFVSWPLGPLADIARACGDGLRDALQRADRPAAFDAFLDELSRPPGPVIVVLEDLQWADEATLDLVRFVARRLPRLPALVIATYRDDLTFDHPLRLALGDLVPPTVARVRLDMLSAEAVGVMARGTAFDPVTLHVATGGNPFFVSEVLVHGESTLPATVRDAVLARAGRLTGGAREALDAAAVLGGHVDHDVVTVVGQCAPPAVDECVARIPAGRCGGAQLPPRPRPAGDRGFDHAVAAGQLHGRALAALSDDADVVRRAHHAIGADDGDAVVDVAPRAAAQCTALGAHREASTLLGGALRHMDRLPPEPRAAVLEARARSCALVDELGDALAAAAEVLAHRRAVGDPFPLASWLTWMAGAYRSAGNAAAATSAIEEAISLLAPFGESVELARAVATLAQQHMLLDASRDAIEVGERAIAMAERLGAEDVAIHALNTVGTSRGAAAMTPASFSCVRASRARAAGLDVDVARAYNNLQSGYVFTYLPREATRCFDEGRPTVADGELRFFEQCMLADHATTLVLDGRWDEAVEHARLVLAQLGTANVHRVSALGAIGRIRARRGDPDPFGPLDEALALAEPYGELQLDHPIRMARAEAAWLAGDTGRTRREVAATVDATMTRGSQWFRGELALWCQRTGSGARADDSIAEPFALHVGGNHRKAGAAWHERGCPYEEADALGDSDDEGDLRRSLELLHALGARPRAVQVARRLRGLGARSLPRGPRPATQANPAGLTARELDVLVLLGEDLRNAEIADRLVVSTKTVDHHVSAILTKLAVTNRRDAVRAAVNLGLSLQDGERAAPR